MPGIFATPWIFSQLCRNSDLRSPGAGNASAVATITLATRPTRSRLIARLRLRTHPRAFAGPARHFDGRTSDAKDSSRMYDVTSCFSQEGSPTPRRYKGRNAIFDLCLGSRSRLRTFLLLGRRRKTYVLRIVIFRRHGSARRRNVCARNSHGFTNCTSAPNASHVLMRTINAWINPIVISDGNRRYNVTGSRLQAGLIIRVTITSAIQCVSTATSFIRRGRFPDRRTAVQYFRQLGISN